MRLRTLIPQEALAARVSELGRALCAELGGEPVVMVGVLTGGFVFLADLIRAMPDQPMSVEFVAARSYSGTSSTGGVQITHELGAPIGDRHVVLVEDIVDTGLTLTRLRAALLARQPRSLRVVTLLDKPTRRRVPFTPDLVGFEIEDRFVVGYGLDLDGAYRNLPYVGELVSDEV